MTAFLDRERLEPVALRCLNGRSWEPLLVRLAGKSRHTNCPPNHLVRAPKQLLRNGVNVSVYDYRITSSARSSNDWGIVSPRALATFMLMTNSNLVGCWIGRSAGLAPLRILST